MGLAQKPLGVDKAISVAIATCLRTFTEEILDPKGLRKKMCSTTGDYLSMVPATSPLTAE